MFIDEITTRRRRLAEKAAVKRHRGDPRVGSMKLLGRRALIRNARKHLDAQRSGVTDRDDVEIGDVELITTISGERQIVAPPRDRIACRSHDAAAEIAAPMHSIAKNREHRSAIHLRIRSEESVNALSGSVEIFLDVRDLIANVLHVATEMPLRARREVRGERSHSPPCGELRDQKYEDECGEAIRDGSGCSVFGVGGCHSFPDTEYLIPNTGPHLLPDLTEATDQ